MREGSATRSFNSAGIWCWIAALLVLAGAGLLLSLRWEEIPERFPVHWNARGEPDNWVDRSPASVGAPLLVGGGLVAFLALLTWGFGKLHRGGKRGAERRSLEAWLLGEILGTVACGLALLFAVIAVQPLRSHPDELPPGFGWWVGVGIAVLSIFILWRSRLAARRLEAIAPQAAEEREFWRWGGILYVNPEDSRLFVPKRVGLGWTLNFGRPVSWLVLAGLLLPVVLVLLPLLVD